MLRTYSEGRRKSVALDEKRNVLLRMRKHAFTRDTARTMSEENVEVADRMADAFNTRSFDLLSELVSQDFEFIPYLAFEIASSSYRGLEGLRRYFEDADTAWENIRVHLDEIRDTDSGFVAFGGLHARGKSSGVDTDVELAWVVELQGGRVRRVHSYGDAGQALEAAGLKK